MHFYKFKTAYLFDWLPGKQTIIVKITERKILMLIPDLRQTFQNNIDPLTEIILTRCGHSRISRDFSVDDVKEIINYTLHTS